MDKEIIKPRKILVRGVNWIGDAVMSMPAVRQLRKAFPQAEIHLLVQDKLSDIWKSNPDINSVIEISPSDSPFAVAGLVKKYDFDIAVIFPNSFRSAIEAWLSGIPRRVGFSFGLRSMLLTDPVKPPHKFVKIKKLSKWKIRRLISENKNSTIVNLSPQHHHIYNYLCIVGAIGASQVTTEPEILVDKNLTELTVNKFGLGRISGRKILGLNPGAEYGIAKRWFPERFTEAAVQIYNKIKCGILIFGGKKDAQYCEQISEAIRNLISEPDCVINLAGKTSLLELCSTLKLCDVVISNDTGPAHIAAAVGTSVVAIFASTSPELTAPGLPGSDKHIIIRSTAPCSPCFRRVCPIDFRCMNEISVGQVVSAALLLFNRPK
jgi:heptosyltransferase-2